MKGPDHSASLEFNELERMINFVRNLSKVLGNGKIEISKSEKENIKLEKIFPKIAKAKQTIKLWYGITPFIIGPLNISRIW